MLTPNACPAEGGAPPRLPARSSEAPTSRLPRHCAAASLNSSAWRELEGDAALTEGDGSSRLPGKKSRRLIIDHCLAAVGVVEDESLGEVAGAQKAAAGSRKASSPGAPDEHRWTRMEYKVGLPGANACYRCAALSTG